VTSCGRACESGAPKAGIGGRGGVAGGAFSLSVACDSWLDRAFWGRGVALASADAVESVGGLGNSLTICTHRQTRLRPGPQASILPHPSGPEYTAASWAILLWIAGVSGEMDQRGPSGGAPTSRARPLRRRSAGWSLLHGVSNGGGRLGCICTGRHAEQLVVVKSMEAASVMMAEAPPRKRDQHLRHNSDRAGATEQLYLRKADQWQRRQHWRRAVHRSASCPSPSIPWRGRMRSTRQANAGRLGAEKQSAPLHRNELCFSIPDRFLDALCKHRHAHRHPQTHNSVFACLVTSGPSVNNKTRPFSSTARPGADLAPSIAKPAATPSPCCCYCCCCSCTPDILPPTRSFSSTLPSLATANPRFPVHPFPIASPIAPLAEYQLAACTLRPLRTPSAR
jgi:hypothetical protein